MRAGSDISVDRMSTTKKTGTVWGGGKTNPIIAAAKIKEQHAKKISKQMKSHGRNMNTATKKTKNPKKHENDIASRAKDTAGNDDNKPKIVPLKQLQPVPQQTPIQPSFLKAVKNHDVVDAVKTAVDCQPVSVRTGREGEVDNRLAGVESNEYALLKTEVTVANGKIASRILEENTAKNPNLIGKKKQAGMVSKTNQNLHDLEVTSHKKACTQTKKVNKLKLGKFAMIDASNIGFGELEEEDDASMNGSRQAIAKIGLEDLEKQFVSKAKVESSNPKRSQVSNGIRGEASGTTSDENAMAVGKRGEKLTRDANAQNASKQKDRDGDAQQQIQSKRSNTRNTVSASQHQNQQNGTFHGNRTYKNNNKQNG